MTKVTIDDIISYILQEVEEHSPMHIHKLLYYCQAWGLAFYKKRMFKEPICAWSSGPVIPDLFERHRGVFKIDKWTGDPDKIKGKRKEVIDKVIDFYGNRSIQWLTDLTHLEYPWKRTRESLTPEERQIRQWGPKIPLNIIYNYYSNI